MPRATGKDRLKMDRLYRAAEKAERALPAAVDALIARISDPKITPKELAICVARLAALADMRPRVEDDLGLVSRREKGGAENPIIAILGNNITVQNFKALPSEEREKLLLVALSGGQGNKVLPGPVVP